MTRRSPLSRRHVTKGVIVASVRWAREVREWASRHRWLSALILLMGILALIYGAFTFIEVWQLQHSSL
jgi:hypothetical protein